MHGDGSRSAYLFSKPQALCGRTRHSITGLLRIVWVLEDFDNVRPIGDRSREMALLERELCVR